MVLLRCPACDRKGEIPGHDPGGRYRCPHCDHTFRAGDAQATKEHNIFAADSPPFLHEYEGLADLGGVVIDPRWQAWVARLAAHCGNDPGRVVHQALAQFASRSGFPEPPPDA